MNYLTVLETLNLPIQIYYTMGNKVTAHIYIPVWNLEWNQLQSYI